jgi:hypothetical protein
METASPAFDPAVLCADMAERVYIANVRSENGVLAKRMISKTGLLASGRQPEGLQRGVLSEDVVRNAVVHFKQQLQEEISNLAGVIATGRHSPALVAELQSESGDRDRIGDLFVAGRIHS